MYAHNTLCIHIILCIHRNAHVYRTGICVECYRTRILSLWFLQDSNLSTRRYRMNALFPTPPVYIQRFCHKSKHQLRNFNWIFSVFCQLKSNIPVCCLGKNSLVFSIQRGRIKRKFSVRLPIKTKSLH